MPGRANVTLKDFDNELSTVSVWTPNLTAANFTAQMGLIDDLVAAIDGVTTGNVAKDTRFASETKFDVAPPPLVWSQRETKWLVRAREAGTGNSVTFEIPTADLTLLLTGTDNLNIAAGAGAALVAAIEALVTSNDGNPITVEEIVHVGRSN